jgi:hypothetical protein
MKCPAAVLAALAGLAVATSSAHAAAPKCDRGGAKVLAWSGNTSVVSVTVRSRDEEDAYGCWLPTGKRFRLFANVGSDENTQWSIVGGRYIGVVRTFMGGVGGGGSAAKSWDARKRSVVHDARACDNIVEDPDQEESGTAGGPLNVVFFRGGGIAYTCAGNMISRIADAKGERALEPNGTTVTSLAVTPTGDRLFYMVGETAKSVGV